MTMRARKFVGTIVLLLLLVVWALGAMVIAQFPVFSGSIWIQLVFYVVAGLGWVLPAMPLISWMEKRDRQ